MSTPPIAAVGALAPGDALAPRPEIGFTSARGAAPFSQWLVDGVDKVNRKLIDADAMAASFAIDDFIPPHQVTIALEQARLSLELMMQVRSRLVEGYQELSRMQL